MSLTVVKFGGSSLADAACFQNVAAIIRENPTRRYVIVSAPGKRFADDIKITDLLLQSCGSENRESLLKKVRERFLEIVSELGVCIDFTQDFEAMRQAAIAGERDFLASRGEYFSSKIMSALLGYEWVDAAECVVFTEENGCDWQATFRAVRERLKNCEYAVIPGFYGATASGSIRTFSRGGSDISGSIVAEAMSADLYENWTDVSGVMMADPRIVENPKPIQMLSYRELRELSYMGASVLHEDAVFPVKRMGIPIQVLNTKAPKDRGTLIVPHVERESCTNPVTGLAGRVGFATIVVEKDMMNEEIGFGAKVLNILAARKISFEHIPSGIDLMCVVVNASGLGGEKERESLLREISVGVNADRISIQDGLALIAVVGRNMVGSVGTLMRLAKALSEAKINIRVIDQVVDEVNIIVGVSENDYAAAMRAIYREFAPQ